MTEHHTTYRISVATINQPDVIFQNREVIILRNVLKTEETFTYISWTYRDLTNTSDKCPRTILKELGSLHLLRIRVTVPNEAESR